MFGVRPSSLYRSHPEKNNNVRKSRVMQIPPIPRSRQPWDQYCADHVNDRCICPNYTYNEKGIWAVRYVMHTQALAQKPSNGRYRAYQEIIRRHHLCTHHDLDHLHPILPSWEFVQDLICLVQIQPRKLVLDHANYAAPTRQYELRTSYRWGI